MKMFSFYNTWVFVIAVRTKNISIMEIQFVKKPTTNELTTKQNNNR